MIKPIKFGLGSIMGNGRQIQSWIHIDDLTQIYCFILENNFEGTYNAVAPNSITNKNLTYLVAKKLGKPLFLPNIPECFMKLVLGEMSILLFSSKNLSSQKIQNLGYKFRYPDFQVALQNILK
jgi:NAD dependent epimerase/dehydratase family enzyme